MAEDLSASPAPIDRKMLEASPFAHIVYTPELEILEVNARHCALTGRERLDLIGANLFAAFPANPAASDADAEGPLRASVQRAIDSGETDEMAVQQHDLADPAGNFAARFWKISHSPVYADPDERDTVIAVLQTLVDVTEEEIARRHESAQMRMARAAATLDTFDYDPTSDVFERPESVDVLFGHGSVRAGSAARSLFEHVHTDDRDGIRAEVRRVLDSPEGEIARTEFRATQPDGDDRWLLMRAEVVHDPRTGNPHLVGVLVDITAMKLIEHSLTRALEGRKILLADVNHRIRNSLQLVISVLNVEAASADNENASIALRRAAGRVQAIASVHNSLHLSENVSNVELGSFVKALADNVHESSGGQERDIGLNLTIDVGDLRLETDRAVPLALIINELLTNAFKHAFPGKRKGNVSVALVREGDSSVVARIHDNGVGYVGTDAGSESLQKQSGTGLGSKLIAALSKQLRAETMTEFDPGGYATTLKFHV